MATSSSLCLTAEELERYSRQIGAGALTSEGQARLKQAAVLVTRAGGMGGPAALALASAESFSPTAANWRPPT